MTPARPNDDPDDRPRWATDEELSPEFRALIDQHPEFACLRGPYAPAWCKDWWAAAGRRRAEGAMPDWQVAMIKAAAVALAAVGVGAFALGLFNRLRRW